jgi:hypothetical protein
MRSIITAAAAAVAAAAGPIALILLGLLLLLGGLLAVFLRARRLGRFLLALELLSGSCVAAKHVCCFPPSVVRSSGPWDRLWLHLLS